MVIHGWELLTSAIHEGDFVFAAKNLPTARCAPHPWIAHLWSVLNRGLPKQISPLMRDRILSRYSDTDLMEATVRPFFYGPTTPNWDEVILGESDRNNPARDFFKNSIPTIFPEYPFLQALILPECPFGILMANFLPHEPINEKERVDFYIPSIRTVIEIDGIQHKEEAQFASDEIRDQILQKRSISVIRISTEDLRNKSQHFQNQIDCLKVLLKNSRELNGPWKSGDSIKYHPPSKASAELVLIERFQQIIVQLLARGAINIDAAWKFGIRTKLNDLSWAKDAIDDILYKAEHLCGLSGVHYSRPKTEVKYVYDTNLQEADTILIDIAFDEWLDGSSTDPRWIVVRNSQVQTHPYQTTNGTNIPLVIQSEPILADRALIAVDPDYSSSSQISSLTAFSNLLFGHSSLRTGQAEIMGTAIRHQKTLGLMTTGAGKSLCFQLPTAIQHGCAIVVCPITALIRDHVAELEAYGFRRRAYSISSETFDYEREFILERLLRGQIKFLFISPEQLQKLPLRQTLAATNAAGHLAYIVIDEVHCVSEWGHDFRTSYLTLAQTIEKYASGVRVICLTATASLRVMSDIRTEFDIPEDSVCYFMQRSREELTFKVIKTEDKISTLRDFLVSPDGFIASKEDPFLIFSPTVNGQTGVAKLLPLVRKWLEKNDIFLFSGALPKAPFNLDSENHILAQFMNKAAIDFSEYKRLVQQLFKANKISGIVATKSFGMGVNKPNIRATFHCGLPSSMESLYQEAGRAGRDGNPAVCITIFKPDNEIPREIMNSETNAENLKLWCDRQSMDAGDFSSQMWLFTRELRSVPEETEACKKVLEVLRSKSTGSVLLTGHSEKILYRLHQLGFIQNWTVENFYKKQYRVEWTDQTPQKIASNIHFYISKYELSVDKREERRIELHGIAENLLKDQATEKLTEFLFQWVYENFFYQRRQSLKNLFDLCSRYDDQYPERFRRELESYFQLNEARFLIHDVVSAAVDNAPRLVQLLLMDSSGNLKSKIELEELSGSVLRFLESYPTNPGLDLLSAMCRLLNGDFENADGRNRMEFYLSALRASQSFGQGWGNLLCLFKMVPLVPRETLLKCVIMSYSELNYSIELYEQFRSEVALEFCVDTINDRISNLVGA